MFGCKHFYGKVQDDGYQYCTKCRKAVAAPAKPQEPVKLCTHKWARKSSFTSSCRFTNSINSETHIMECEHCGDMKKEIFSIGSVV